MNLMLAIIAVACITAAAVVMWPVIEKVTGRKKATMVNPNPGPDRVEILNRLAAATVLLVLAAMCGATAQSG